MSLENRTRLDGKEIATYLGVNAKTVRRWEKTRNLPLHRSKERPHHPYAFADELDTWKSTKEGIEEFAAEERPQRTVTSFPQNWPSHWRIGLITIVALTFALLVLPSMLRRPSTQGVAPETSVNEKPWVDARRPQDAMDVYREASDAFNAKKYTDAIALLDKAIKLDFRCYECFHLRGQARSMLKTYRAAIADFDQALRLNEKGAWSYYERGCAYAAIEEHDFAKRDFELAIALLPNDPKADLLYNHLGIALQNLARRYNHDRTLYERALQCFSEAIRRNPRNGYAYHRRGAVYQALGEIDKARADYDRAIPLLPPAEREWARRDKAGLTPSAPSKGGNGE